MLDFRTTRVHNSRFRPRNSPHPRGLNNLQVYHTPSKTIAVIASFHRIYKIEAQQKIFNLDTSKMSSTPNINHESSINADSVYTSYKWILNDWVDLYDYKYGGSVESPEIQFMHDKECKCVLIFRARSKLEIPPVKAKVEVKFLTKFAYHGLRARVSLVDKNMKKLLQTPKKCTHCVPPFVVLTFNQSLGPAANPYLQDGALILFFEMRVIKAINMSPVSTSVSNSNSNNEIRTKFASMFEKNKFCDVTFIVEGQTLSAHKLVLAAKSAIFEAKFETDLQEKKEDPVKIDDVSAKIFNIFLKYMYTDTVNGMEDVVTKLIVVADKYQVMDLVNLCETYMTVNLQLRNVIQYLVIAHRMHLSPLEEKAIELIKRNKQVLVDSAEYKLSDYPALIGKINNR